MNDGIYGTCKNDCTPADFCGDGIKNGSEQCDLGAGNSASAYGTGKCTNACKVAPYCGDHRVNGTGAKNATARSAAPRAACGIRSSEKQRMPQ